ncbi:MAG: hypothetical protein J6S21_03745 [Victivallales bacterium]|jgi:putative FmdB family regulatory protein|nr:hypothetical protein [Victivallales bacterium]
MPIFDYECPACGSVSEIRVVRFDDQPSCPACGYEKLRKLPAVFSSVSSEAAGPDCGGCRESGGHQCCGGCCHHGGH